MPGYHREFDPGFEEDHDERPPTEKSAPQSPTSVTTFPINEKGVAHQIGESKDCKDGRILRI